jgi:hypothetical protein
VAVPLRVGDAWPIAPLHPIGVSPCRVGRLEPYGPVAWTKLDDLPWHSPSRPVVVSIDEREANPPAGWLTDHIGKGPDIFSCGVSHHDADNRRRRQIGSRHWDLLLMRADLPRLSDDREQGEYQGRSSSVVHEVAKKEARLCQEIHLSKGHTAGFRGHVACLVHDDANRRDLRPKGAAPHSQLLRQFWCSTRNNFHA